MLYTKNDSASYVQQFKKKMTNFADKAPLLLSFTTTPIGVQIVNESTDDVWDIPWDFSVPVKLFIYGIKQILIKDNAYPILTKVERTTETYSQQEQVDMAVSGIPVEDIPVTKIIENKKQYRIDKLIVYKDIFIIEDIETQQKFRYQMNKSSVFFLQKIRSHKLNSETAADYFFANSKLMNEIILKNDEDSESN